MPALYFLLTVLAAGVLVFLMRQPGAARAMTVWALAALLPVLAALSAALSAQGHAERTLSGVPAQDVQVTVTTTGQSRTLTLSAQDAACVARALHLNARVTLDNPGGRMNIGPGTQVGGTLPERATVEAMSIRGLTCPHLRAQRGG
ncbi:hypothetical protein [Deinococcus sp.]|uniref:hypothetical protein n=1 Tax=Deinococcus sp. TaxID=47478 RepID=UPI002869D8EE|nr:hypothetical protein [Deinococcus sp.]